MAIALHHSRAKGTAKIVMLGIANHDGDGGAWPSIDTLCKYANVTRRNVRDAIKTLVQLGEVEVLIQAGGTISMADTHRPNLYRIRLSCPADCDRSSNHRTARRKSIDLELHDLFESEGGVAGDPGSHTTPEGVAGDLRGGSHTTPEPSINSTTRQRGLTHHSARARECPVSTRISPTGEHVRLDTGCCLNCGADLRERVSA
jgi:hypothetical protein